MESQNLRNDVFVWLLMYLACLTSHGGVAATKSCDFPDIFNFGDSNSDTGGLAAAFGLVPAPHGETYFHHPAGRNCDGRLIIDLIAESLVLSYLRGYLDSVGSNFSHGANFATDGSIIRPQNMTISQSEYSHISLNVQVVQFSDFHQKSQTYRNQGGVFNTLLPRADYFSKALYTFDIVQDDLTDGYKLNLTTEQVKAYVPELLTQLSDTIKVRHKHPSWFFPNFLFKKHTIKSCLAVRKVYDQGGRSFWIHNTGPVGCYPYSLDRFLITAAQIDEYRCASPFKEVAQYFNQRLRTQTLLQLRTDLPLAAITYVDIYTLKYKMITEAEKFGFEKPFVACCGHGGKYNYNSSRRCGSKVMINGEEVLIANSCKDPSVRIIWDGVHFTEAANKWVFEQIVNGFYSDPPVPLKMACLRST